MTIAAHPELIRISVLGTDTQVDVALPATAPIVALMPDVVRLLRLPPPSDSHDDIGNLPRWTLARVGDSPFASGLSLSEAGVVDGELLLLHDDLPSTPGALVDDVVDGLAHLTRRRSPGWMADDARRLGYAIAVVAAIACVVAGRAPGSPRLAVLIVACALTAMGMVAIAVANHLGAKAESLACTSVCCWLAAALAGSLVPPPDSPAAAIACAGGAALTVVLVAHRSTGVAPGLHAFGGTVAALTMAGGIVGMTLATELRQAIAVTAVLGLVAVLLAARFAIAAGRLPLPPVPSVPPPGPFPVDDVGQIDGVDAVRRDSGTLSSIAELALVDLRDLERRAAVVNAYLTGIVIAGAAVTASGIAGVAAAYRGSLPATLFCIAVAAVLLARGRTHTDRWQSTSLLCAGALSLLGAAFAHGSTLTVFFGALAVAASAFIIGATASLHEFSPLQRRTLELAEYFAIAAVIPLLLWMLDAYRAIRGF